MWRSVDKFELLGGTPCLQILICHSLSALQTTSLYCMHEPEILQLLGAYWSLVPQPPIHRRSSKVIALHSDKPTCEGCRQLGDSLSTKALWPVDSQDYSHLIEWFWSDKSYFLMYLYSWSLIRGFVMFKQVPMASTKVQRHRSEQGIERTKLLCGSWLRNLHPTSTIQTQTPPNNRSLHNDMYHICMISNLDEGVKSPSAKLLHTDRFERVFLPS